MRSAQSLAVCQGLRDAGYHVIAVDASHSLNDVGSDLDQWMPADHANDLADALTWVQAHIKNLSRRFSVAGNSFGAYAALDVAAQYAASVDNVIAVCPITSGKNSLEARQKNAPAFLSTMANVGFIDVPADVNDLPAGKLTNRAWEEWRDHLDVFKAVQTLQSYNVKIGLIVGDKDIKTPVDHVRQLPGPLTIIKGANHSFTRKADELQAAVIDTIKQLNTQIPLPRRSAAAPAGP